MDVEVELSREEYMASSKQVYKTVIRKYRATNTYRILNIIYYVILVGICLSIIAALDKRWGTVNWTYWSLLISLTSLYYFRLTFEKSIRKHILTQKWETSGKRRYSITEDALVVESGHSKTFICWSDVESVDDRKELILAYVGFSSAFSIPRRCFHSSSDAEAFADALRARVAKAGEYSA